MKTGSVTVCQGNRGGGESRQIVKTPFLDKRWHCVAKMLGFLKALFPCTNIDQTQAAETAFMATDTAGSTCSLAVDVLTLS